MAADTALYFGKTIIPASQREVNQRQEDFHTMHKVGDLLMVGIGLPHLQDEDEWRERVFGEKKSKY